MKIALIAIATFVVGLFLWLAWRQLLHHARVVGARIIAAVVRCVQQSWFRIRLCGRMGWVIKKHYQNHLIEMVFESYCHFYEHHMDQIQSMAYSGEFFPNGHGDLVRVYEYIRDIRENNWTKYDSIEVTPAKVRYKRYWWSSFNFSVNKNHSIDILMHINDGETDTFSRNKSTKLRLHNVLHKLDNDMAIWIIERRGFFLV